MTRACALLLATLLCGACGGEKTGTVVYVTVRARPTVQPSATLHVEVRNAGGSVSQDFTIEGESFPRTFTITPTGRTGDLEISVQALGSDDVPRASGAVTAVIVPDQVVDAEIMLDPDDFLVNQEIVRTQWLSFREELAGRQVGVAPDGSFVIAWENDCPLSRCDIVARLFSPDTVARQNGTTMNDGDFIVNQVSEYTESPVIAAGANGYLVAWLAQPDMMTFTLDVKATILDDAGRHTSAFDIVVSNDALQEQAPTAFALEGGGWVVAWQRELPAPAVGTEIRARLYSADGTPRVNGETLDDLDFPVTTTTTGNATLPHGAALPGGGFVIVWSYLAEGTTVTNVQSRVFTATGEATTTFSVPVTNYGGSAMAYYPHVSATLNGFIVGWQAYEFQDPIRTKQPLYIRRYAPSGTALSGEIMVTDATNNFYSKPVVGARTDGAIGVSWVDCMASGDAAGCGIKFRLFHPNGLASGDAFVANTTINGDQLSPSMRPLDGGSFLVAWTDGSGQPPDTDGSGVRARVVYPNLERHDGAIGARCESADPACAEGLLCAPTAAGAQLCHVACTTECPTGGTCTDGACKFD